MENTLMVPAMPTELENLVQEFGEEMTQGDASASKAIVHYHRGGKVATKIKQELGHGRFGKWLENNPYGSATKIRGCMRIATEFPELPTWMLDMSYRSALQLVAKPSGIGLDQSLVQQLGLLEPPSLRDDVVLVGPDQDGITQTEIWPDPKKPGRHAILRCQVWDAENVSIEHDRQSVVYTPRLLRIALGITYHVRPRQWYEEPLNGREPWFLNGGERRAAAFREAMTRAPERTEIHAV